MLEHGSEHCRPGTQHSLVALDGLLITLDGHVSQGPGLQQVLHVRHQVPAPVVLLLNDVLNILPVVNSKWNMIR